MNIKITVLGAGAWGSAVATVLASNGHDVTLWCFESEVTDEIQRNHCNNRYLQGVTLNQNLKTTSSMQEALEDCSFVFEAIPLKFLRTTLEHAKLYAKPEVQWVVLSKGMELDRLLFPSQVIDEIIKSIKPVVVFGGPSFAKELVEGVFTGFVIASQQKDNAKIVSSLVKNNHIKTYITDDIYGVQMGGAVKNIIALMMGIALGTGQQENTRAYLFTHGLCEMVRLTHLFGGRRETIFGLAGLGDMMLTCTGSLSKNLKIGKLLGQGLLLSDLAEQYPALPEGINTLQSIHQFMKEKNTHLPICQGVYDFIFEGKSFKNLLHQLNACEGECEFE